MSQQRYAYLIGANGPEQMALRYAESDALRLAEALIGPFCKFTEAKAAIAESRDAGLAGLQELARRCDPSDTLLVHFSGHAIFDRRLYLLSNTTDCDNLYVTAIDIRTVKDIMSDCRAQSKLLILDCCHAKGAYEEALKGEEDIHEIVRQTAQGGAGKYPGHPLGLRAQGRNEGVSRTRWRVWFSLLGHSHSMSPQFCRDSIRS